MKSRQTSEWIALDKQHSWHPFTQMQDWCDPDYEPVVLERGEGALLYDSDGRSYIDGNSSIWTNIHGHNHPRINAAIEAQLRKVAHTSFLGFTHSNAGVLAKRLTDFFPDTDLQRVFFSDDGSTAIESAVKMAVQFRQLNGEPDRVGFIAFHHAYHGDTMGASSLGGVPLFHKRFSRHHFPVTHVADLSELYAVPDPKKITAIIIEPLIQGVAGMKPWRKGMLQDLRKWCDTQGVFLILDEVMTGFGRTGTMFACQQESVLPDFLCLAKGLTGGYLPLAATLVRERIFAGFLGNYEEQKTFFYGHSYTANQLGCAAALASLDIFEEEKTLEKLQAKITLMRFLSLQLENISHVGKIRQTGFIAGIPLWLDASTEQAFDWRKQIGARVCHTARKYGLLTRPIGDVIVLMPPLCTTNAQLRQSTDALSFAIREVCQPD